MPLPSLFFIGKNGAPIEIVTGVTKTLDELNSKIDGVLNGVKPKSTDISSATASANLIASKESKKSIDILQLKFIKLTFFSGEQSAQSASNEENTEIVRENGFYFKHPEENKTETASTENTTNGSTSNEEKLSRAKELIEKKRKEKEEEDARVSKHKNSICFQCKSIIFFFIIFSWQKSVN